jgi:hypothetical protein
VQNNLYKRILKISLNIKVYILYILENLFSSIFLFIWYEVLIFRCHQQDFSRHSSILHFHNSLSFFSIHVNLVITSKCDWKLVLFSQIFLLIWGILYWFPPLCSIAHSRTFWKVRKVSSSVSIGSRVKDFWTTWTSSVIVPQGYYWWKVQERPFSLVELFCPKRISFKSWNEVPVF